MSSLRIGGEIDTAIDSKPASLRIDQDEESFERLRKTPVLKNHEEAFEQYQPGFKFGEEETSFEKYNNNQKRPIRKVKTEKVDRNQKFDYPFDEQISKEKVVLVPFDHIKIKHHELTPKEIKLQQKWIQKQARRDVDKEFKIIEKEMYDKEYEYDDDVLCENEQNYKRAMYPLTQVREEFNERTPIEYEYQEKCMERKAFNDARREEEIAYRKLIH